MNLFRANLADYHAAFSLVKVMDPSIHSGFKTCSCIPEQLHACHVCKELLTWRVALQLSHNLAKHVPCFMGAPVQGLKPLLQPPHSFQLQPCWKLLEVLVAPLQAQKYLESDCAVAILI